MRKGLLTAGLAAMAAAAFAGPASAEIIVPSGSLTEPGGVVRVPDGTPGGTKLYVADGLTGICEVKDGLLVTTDYCQPEVEPPPGAEEPAAATAPEPSDLAYDAASNTLWATEGTSGSSGIWRMQLGLDGTITSATKIVDTTAGDDRAWGLDLTRVEVAPGVTELEVDFVTKRSLIVRRVLDATGPAPVVQPVGVSLEEDVADVSRLGDKLYLAEPAGVTVIDTPGGADRESRPVDELAGHLAGALIDDEAAGRLYLGTDAGAGADEIVAYEPASGRAEAYAGGLSGVGALALETLAGHEGAVLAADDPAVASGAVDAVGGGRVMRFANVPLGRPRIVLGDPAPPILTTAQSITFTFSSTVPGATIECKLDAAAWEECPDGTKTFAGLTDGPHEAAFRATGAGVGMGAELRHVFVVDTGPPSVTIDNPESDRTVTGQSLDLRFTASEGGATFDCAVDGAAPAPCSSPLRLRRLAYGDHEVVVTATDMVGQTTPADAAARWAFKNVPPAPPAEPARPEGGNSGPGNRDDRPRTPDVIRPFTTADSSFSCRSAITRRLDMKRPPAVLRIAFPGGFKPAYVRMAITKKGKSGKSVKLAGMQRILETSRPCTTVSWGLWRNEARKLRKGTYTLTVLAGRDRRAARRVWSGSLRVVR